VPPNTYRGLVSAIDFGEGGTEAVKNDEPGRECPAAARARAGPGGGTKLPGSGGGSRSPASPSPPLQWRETDGILSSEPVGQGTAARALGQLPGPTDGCVDRPISVVPDFFTAASTGDPGHLDVHVLRARRDAAYTNGSRGRARALVRPDRRRRARRG